MSAVLKFDYALETMECPNCFIVFALPKRFISERRADHRTFYCPVGHWMNYKDKSEAEQLKEQLEREQQKSALLERTARTERLAHEATKKKLHRVGKGTCPECNRHFKNVERHMKSKHAAQ